MSLFAAFVLSMVGATVMAQTPSAPSPIPLGLIDPGLLELGKVFGFGAMIFIVWWWDAKKISKLTAIIDKYDTHTKAYEKLAEECRDSNLMSVRIQARLVEKLESLERRREIVHHEQS
jgi:hypothetical protein